MIITVKYLCKYRLNFAKNYVFSGDKCFNSKTNSENVISTIKQNTRYRGIGLI